MMQPSIFEEHPIRKQADFLAFHDESEPVANKGWLLIGVLFVQQNKRPHVEQILQYHRQKENYSGEIHFCQLPKSFGGEYGAKARVARRWMKAYQDGLFQDALFTCLAVDRAMLNPDRFNRDYHIYNRFTAMAIKGGISYLLAPLEYESITLTFISDGRSRKSKPDQNMVDNFEEYLPYRVELDNFIKKQTSQQRYPSLTMNRVEVIDSQNCNLIQLTDLLLGAVQSALMGISKRPVKQELGRMVVHWYQDLQKPRWQRQYNMNRKFSLWGFPDKNGKPFNQFSMAISSSPPGQLTLS